MNIMVEPPSIGSNTMQRTPSGWTGITVSAAVVTLTLGIAAPVQAASSESVPGSDIGAMQHRRSGRRMAAGGLATFGVAYAASMVAGGIARWGLPVDAGLLTQQEDQRLRTYGARMFVPVVGPFMAAPEARPGEGRAFTISAGLTQSLGLGLAIVGVIRAHRRQRASRWSVHPMAGRGRIGVGFALRFR